MSVTPIYSFLPTFRGKYGVKELYMSDKLPSVKNDIYGIPLSKKTCSREHVIPKSLGGSSGNSNIALADVFINNKRGNQPLNKFTNIQNVVNYLLQFVGIEIKEGKIVKFNGDKYISDLLPSLKHEGLDIDISDSIKSWRKL